MHLAAKTDTGRMLPTFIAEALGSAHGAMLLVALAIALGFEFVNGFHDAANAVATVIYTNALPPRAAVAWSGLCNFVGVLVGGTGVAFGIVRLLPVDLVVATGSGSGEGLAMILALLIAAIAWNLGTWSLGLPASSSHTLVGAILGVGLAHAALNGEPLGSGVRWDSASAVGLSLLISPVVGFVLAAGLYAAFRKFLPDRILHEPPPEGQPPPPGIRAVLIGTCTGVSLAHGSNDGQKGIGLVMLILIGLAPAQFALDPGREPGQVARVEGAVAGVVSVVRAVADRSAMSTGAMDALSRRLADLGRPLSGHTRMGELGPDDRWQVRTDLLWIDDELTRIDDADATAFTEAEREALRGPRAILRAAVDFVPTWTIAAVAVALGSGTMVGWRRIVVTVGEKIGKAHLSYAQGASAELVAMTTIGLADLGGLPVSTTHVVSSGIAGTMAAHGTGLQWGTVRNIALAWVFTLPAAMALAASLFAGLRLVL